MPFARQIIQELIRRYSCKIAPCKKVFLISCTFYTISHTMYIHIWTYSICIYTYLFIYIYIYYFFIFVSGRYNYLIACSWIKIISQPDFIFRSWIQEETKFKFLSRLFPDSIYYFIKAWIILQLESKIIARVHSIWNTAITTRKEFI